MRDEWTVTDLGNLTSKTKESKDTVDVYIPYDEVNQDASWVVELARSEEEIEQTGVINYEASHAPEKILKDATVYYLRSLRNHISKLAALFNSNKSISVSGIKVYAIGNTEADFMVFRNSLKLIFSAQRPGVIQISFNAHTGGFFTNTAVNPNGSSEQLGDIIHAQLGPFNEAVWTYQGRSVNTKEMLRYYITRFIQNSSR